MNNSSEETQKRNKKKEKRKRNKKFPYKKLGKNRCVKFQSKD